MSFRNETIAAISTPPGTGGVALLRVSGADAVSVAGRVFLPKCGLSVGELEPRRAYFGGIASADGALIDDGIITLFRAPHSYTGEDVAEICCHGGALLTEKVLSALFAAGAAPAEAGEFTLRAVTNGKMSLTEAEGVANLYTAATDAQLSLARNAKNGVLARKIGDMYDLLKRLLAGLYAKIDFPDEDLSDMPETELRENITSLVGAAEALEAGYPTARAVLEGINTVICGRPNVGKSRLYNSLAGRELAIVTDTAGTTRDLLSASLPCGKVLLRLTDTAGLRRSADKIEIIGIERALGALAEAELVLAVFDGSEPATAEDISLLGRLAEITAPKIALINKSDIGTVFDRAVLGDEFTEIISISAADGDGIDKLRDTVERLFTDGKINLSDDALVTNARQFAAVTRAKAALVAARTTLDMKLAPELVGDELETALRALGELDGRDAAEDVIAEIFSRFCVGK